MVLIYYAQVCFGWLPFIENKGKDVANYIKEEGYLLIEGKSGRTGYTPYLGDLAQILGS